MNNTPDPDSPTPTPAPATPAPALPRTLLLAGAFFLIPVLAGILFVLASHRLSPPPAAPSAASAAALTNRLHDGSATNAAQLTALRRDLRGAGLPTDEADLRLWAARAAEPERLFRVPPPTPGPRWNWHLAHDGLHALAVSAQPDAAGRRTVGLYDLPAETWVWTNALPWPDTHESPYVFNRHTVVRYTKNAVRFALEADDRGRIVSIDKLGAGAAAPPAPIPFSPRFPALPCIAVRHNVFFTADPQDGALLGYANQPLPGLRPAGPCDAATAFSGDGLLKFSASPTGIVTAADSLTLTPLQHYRVWPTNSLTACDGMAASADGSNLTVRLTSLFTNNGQHIRRRWDMAIDLYSGKGNPDFTPPPAPVPAPALTALSPDGRWRLAVNAANELTLSAPAAGPGPAAAPPAARVTLAPLGLHAPVRSIAFLENGRHLLIRQDTDAWLLDFTAARAYGGLAARAAACSRTISLDTYLIKRETNRTDTAQLALSPDGYGTDQDFNSSDAPDPNAPAPAYLALRAELLAANQAWGYAAALFEAAARLQENDSRAPRINPLLLARCQLLAGQRQKARDTCRTALRALLARPVSYDFATGAYRSPPNVGEHDNRMIRYHLQGLLFSAEQ